MGADQQRLDRLRSLLPSKSEALEALSREEAVARVTADPQCCSIVYVEDYTGLELVRDLEAAGASVVVITSPGNEALAATSLKLGAHDFVVSSNLTADALRDALLYAVEKKRRQVVLHDAAKRYEELFDDPLVMYVITRNEDGKSVIVDCNNAFSSKLGYSREEVLGRGLLDFFDSRWLDLNLDERPELLEPDDFPEECELRGEGGRRIHALVRAVPERNVAEQSARGVRVTLVDITKRVTAEGALEESEARARAFLDALPDTLIRLERRLGRVALFPARETTTLEDESEWTIGNAHRELPHEIHKDFERYFDLAQVSHGAATFEYTLDIDGQSRNLEARVVASGTDEGLAIIRDLTAQKDLERQLLQSQRLEAVGRLAGGIAHDFNNILTVISGYAELSLADSAADDTESEIFQEIFDASKRASDLTRQLLAFSRKQILQPRPIDLNQLVSSLEKMLRRVIGEDVHLRKELDKELGTITADPGQIEQILMNLAVNARDAMPNGGELSFRTENCEFHETYVGDELRIPSGLYVSLKVSDTGEGMDEQTRAHIFEPFFTTKEKGRGTGLGLSTVYGIVKQSGGYIFVYSEPGHGSVFKMYFPREEARHVHEPVESEPLDVGGDETILLVEDDPRVLEFAATVLEREGYRVIRARSGEEALSIVRSYPDEIHLVATDVVMAGMSGRNLAESLAPLRGEVKVLYMSGYTDDAIDRHGLLGPGTRFLEKPYTRKPLLRAVRQTIDSNS